MSFIPVAAVIAAALLAVGGCASPEPIYNVSAALPASSRSMSMNEVQTAIQRAGTSLGWYIHPEGPGHLVGRLPLRTHLAVVDIEHDAKSYSIKYRESANLDAGHGMIHPNYNEWVQSLDRAIRSQLLGP
jgi:hypothetical protein